MKTVSGYGRHIFPAENFSEIFDFTPPPPPSEVAETQLVIAISPFGYTCCQYCCLFKQTAIFREVYGFSIDVSEFSIDVSELSIDVSEFSIDISQLSIDVSDFSIDVSQLSIDVSDFSIDVSQLSLNKPYFINPLYRKQKRGA